MDDGRGNLNRKPYRQADGTAWLVVRSEFTTPHGKLLRGTSLPHGMENSPTHFAPVQLATPRRGDYRKKRLFFYPSKPLKIAKHETLITTGV